MVLHYGFVGAEPGGVEQALSLFFVPDMEEW